MSGFKKTREYDRLQARQRGGVVVYLESEDDYQIIAKRWFFDAGEEVTFIPADGEAQGETGGGGCQVVLARVQAALADQVTAFGIVDRDILLNDHRWDLWWEEDDARFLAARPYGEAIRVLLRWELENYLLEPEILAGSLSDGPRMVDPLTATQAAAQALALADELKMKSAATVVLIANRHKGLAPGFGCNPQQRGNTLQQGLEAHLGRKGVASPSPEMANARHRIDRFDRPAAPPQQRWDRLVRLLDGKAALKYLDCVLGTPLNETRAAIARRMREIGQIPAEIAGYVEEFRHTSP